MKDVDAEFDETEGDGEIMIIVDGRASRIDKRQALIILSNLATQLVMVDGENSRDQYNGGH